MNRKISLGATIGLIALAITLTVTLTMRIAMRLFDASVSDLSERQAMYSYVDAVDKLVRQHYASLDEERLHVALVEGYIKGIDDPYAAYLTANERAAAELYDEGKLTGYGFEYCLTDEGATVAWVHANSPAGKAGILTGDCITTVNGTALDAENRETLLKNAFSADTMLLGVTRTDEKPISFSITPATFEMTTVSERMIGNVGYIRIRDLCASTYAEFKAAYSALESSDAAAYIFDVRGTANGLIDTTHAILNFLLPRCNYGYSVNTSSEMQLFTVEETHQLEVPSVVLVDEKTACAAELFAGAMQKYGHSTVVGAKTAGKGKVQERLSIKTDNSAVLLTVRQVFLYGGIVIEGIGITPTKPAADPERVLPIELLGEAVDFPLHEAVSVLNPGYFQTPVTTEPGTDEPLTTLPGTVPDTEE